MEYPAGRCVHCDQQVTGQLLDHYETCIFETEPSQDEPPSYASVAVAPTHNLSHLEIQQEKEQAMTEDFCNWTTIWYKTLVKCTLSKLLCEPQGWNKLKTHGLAIWVSRRSDYSDLDESKAYISAKASRNGSASWDSDRWTAATSFKIEYSRMVPWDHLSGMLASFPMDEAFLSSFRTIGQPNQLRIVAFLAPSFLSYDSMSIWQKQSSRVPIPRWTFPVGSRISSPVQDLIMRTMPFFQPLVTSFEVSKDDVKGLDNKRYSKFDDSAWEWVIKQVVDQGWYSNDGNNWVGLLDKIACSTCRGKVNVSSEVKAGLAFLAKADGLAGRSHTC